MEDIGYRIKCIRKEKNLNQTQFGISQGNLSEIEMDNSNPSADTLVSLRQQYNVNLNWLLTGSEAEDGTTYIDDSEKQLLEGYRRLNDYDKIEIIEIVELKNRLQSLDQYS